MTIKFSDVSEADLKRMAEEHKKLNPDLPMRENIKDALDSYGFHGRPLGGFLTAVVENDLMQALARADSYNRATIFQICKYVYNELPAPCHGSPEKVAAWYKNFEPKNGA